jgi:hypothetical protein
VFWPHFAKLNKIGSRQLYHHLPDVLPFEKTDENALGLVVAFE